MTQIATADEDLEATEPAAVSPVPDLVRVAIVGQYRQVDLSLPLDVPVALLVSEVVRLFDGAFETEPGTSTTPPAGAEDNAKDVVWALFVAKSGTPLAPDDTLRDARVAQDDVLVLRARSTLTAPTLYDDVVDAAAHLNQSGHAGWDPSAARRIAYLGVGLTTGAWSYLVLTDASSPRRAEMLGLSAFVTATLFVVAAIFARSSREPQAGAVLGWACLPIAAAACWAGLWPHGSLAVAGGALALMLLCAAGYRLVGAGAGGFIAAGVFFACNAMALAACAAGLTRIEAATCLAVATTVATLAIPRMTARLDYSRPVRSAPAHGGAPTESTPSPGEGPGTRVALASSQRGGLYAGFAVGACCAAAAVVWATPTPSWSTLAFGMVCAMALGLPRADTRTAYARLMLGLPAAALVVATGFAATRGGELMSVAGASTLLAGSIVFAAIGFRPGSAPLHPRWRALLSLCSYLAFTLVGPSALWTVGAYSEWSVG